MKNFETVYKELERLLIHQLPDIIEKINKEHNDGIIIRNVENKNLEEKCIKVPSFLFNIEETEYSEKDRLIENTVFSISLEIKLQPQMENKIIISCRYIEALKKLFSETETTYSYKIEKQLENKIYIRITQVF